MKICIGLAFVVLAGCATQDPPAEYRHALFDQMNIHSISIMPILDRRSEKTDLKLTDHILGQVTPELTKRGYEFSLVKDPKLVEDLSTYDFLPKIQPRIASLDLGGEEWLLFIVVEQAGSEIKFSGSHGYSHLSGYLYNRETGEKLWEGVGKGVATNGLLFHAMSDGTALKKGAELMAAKFPESLRR